MFKYRVYIAKPFYEKTVEIEETNEKFSANLIWLEKNVILFLNDRLKDYEIAKKTGWYVFFTKEGFDVKDFLEKVSE